MKIVETQITFIDFNRKPDSHFRELYEQVNRKEKNKKVEWVLCSFNKKCKRENLIDINVFGEKND